MVMRPRSRSNATPYEAILERGYVRDGECLLSNATPQSSGYRYIQQGRVSHYAHRVSYRMWRGEIPEGLAVDHMCHNEAVARGECEGGACKHRRCFNPTHLQLLSFADNVRASPLSGYVRSWRSRLTECKRGHMFDEKNTYYPRGGGRSCRACMNMHQKNYALRKKAIA